MNYRHIYHAGNFADVFKHIVVCRILQYLKRKDNAFRVIDTHSGTGLYDLRAIEAQKTGEWLNGVGRFLAEPISVEMQPLLEPWLSSIQAVNNHEHKKTLLDYYPGSPLIVRHLLRKQDRLAAIELHPQDFQTLLSHFSGDYQTRVLHLDGWLALKAHLPPKEKRGFILVDPPFEQAGEFDRLVAGLSAAYRRFPGGIYALWYPVKHISDIKSFFTNLTATGIKRILRLEIQVNKPTTIPAMTGCGMVIVNPPYVLENEIKTLAPFLAQRLGQKDMAAKIKCEWIRGE